MKSQSYPPPRKNALAFFLAHIDILEWFANSEYEFICSIYIIDNAAKNGHIEILKWFANSKYEFKYSKKAINIALIYHKLEILKWFDESKYEIKYTPKKIKRVLEEDCTDIYEYLGPNSRIIKILDSQKIDK